LKGSRVQTPMLAAKISETAPYNWHGTSATLEASIAQTVERLGGTGLSEADRRALARYLREGLRAPARPEVKNKDKPLVALGREVFERSSVGCAECHTTDGTFTDSARHDVGSLSAAERDELITARSKERTPWSFDTPSLIGVGLTAPYFHDGSAPTLEALVAQNRDRMGHTSKLSQREQDALVAYLKTL
jgi:cytochrome c peroxidase